jgi:hypothetical protein
MEYVQRYDSFGGFCTRENVTKLNEAAFLSSSDNIKSSNKLLIPLLAITQNGMIGFSQTSSVPLLS